MTRSSNGFHVVLKKQNIPEKVRAQALARVYAEILSWPDPCEALQKEHPDIHNSFTASGQGR